MPSPTTSVTVRNSDLGGSLVEFDLLMDQKNYIWNQVAPVLDVAQASGQYGVIPVEQLLQDRETKRAPGGGYSRGQFQFELGTYSTTEHGAEEPVDENEAAMYADFFNAEVIARNRAVTAVLRNAEKRWAAAIFNTTTWTGSSLTTAVGTEWSVAATAAPIGDVEAACRKVWTNSGVWPNALVINRHVFRNLRLCDQITDRISATGAGDKIKASDISAAMLAACFDLDFIIVGGGAKNSAIEGQAVSIDKIWSDEYAMVCRVATSNDIQEPCIARTLHWAKDGSSILGTVEDYEEPQTRSKIIRCRHQVAEKVMYIQAGHLLSNITA